MARFFSTLIQENLLGNGSQDITVTSSGGSSLNNLLANIGSEKYLICSLNIFSTNQDQLREPIILKREDVNGNENRFVIAPQLDSYQKQSILNNIDTQNFELDENHGFEYKLLANTIVKITLNICDKQRELLSNSEYLAKETGLESLQNTLFKEFKIEEPEEIVSPKVKPNLNEPEEVVKPIIVSGKFKSRPKIKKQVKKKEVKKPKKIIKSNKNLIKLAVATGIYLFLAILDDEEYFKL